MKWLLIVIGGLALIVGIIAAVGALLPRSHVAARSGRYKESPAVLWDVLVDVRSFPFWRKDLKSVEILPDHDGHAMWREVGRERTVTMERVEMIPGRRIVMRIADTGLPFGGYWIYELRPDGDGTVLTVTERGEIYNPIFRFFARFVFGYTKSMEEYLRGLGEKLGDRVEPQPADPAH